MMKVLTMYALQSALCLTLFYVPYQLMLRRETFFRLNRMVLLGIMTFALVMPLLPITLPAEVPAINVVEFAIRPQGEANQPFVVHNSRTTYSAEQHLSLQSLVYLIYIIGAVSLLAWHLIAICGIRTGMRHGCLWTSRENDGITIYCHAGEVASYSWLHSIVISEDDYLHHPEILAHERAHIRHCHSFDNLLVVACQCVQWFNPFVWLLADSLSDVHEFEADADVIRNGHAKEYQLLLVAKATSTGRYALVNGFGRNHLKRRLQMMLCRRSAPWSRLKLIVLLPLMVLAVLLLAKHEVIQEQMNVEIQKHMPVKAAQKTVADTVRTPVIIPSGIRKKKHTAEKTQPHQKEEEPKQEPPTVQVATQMAQFPGGNVALRNYMATHLQQTEATGQVFLRFTVAEDGSIQQVKVLRSGGDEADRAALQMMADMPRWIPGRRNGHVVPTYYTLPVSF